MSKLEKTRASKTHQRYFVDGVQVPGVTTVMSVLAKPAFRREVEDDDEAAREQERDERALADYEYQRERDKTDIPEWDGEE